MSSLVAACIAPQLSKQSTDELGRVGVVVKYVKTLKEAAAAKASVLVTNVEHKVGAADMWDGLRAVVTLSVGRDHIDAEAAAANDTQVISSPGSNAEAVSSLALCLAHSLLRKVVMADTAVRAGRWNRTEFMGRDLTGATSEVESHEAVRGRCIKVRSLPRLMANSDVVSLHVPLNESTRGIIGPKELSLIKSGAVLVNTSRGGLVDLVAAAVALKEGHLGGLALDVFEQEPPTLPKDLLTAPNLILTPHIGAMTRQARVQMEFVAINNLAEFVEHELPHAGHA